MAAHEDLTRDQRAEGSSDRAFGFVFSVFFLIVAAWPMLHANSPRWWVGGVAAVWALVALLRPTLLAGLNRLWTALGLLMGRIVSPIALGLLFYCVITPIGRLMHLAGRDPLLLKRDPGAASYWRRRDPPGPRPDSMTHPF